MRSVRHASKDTGHLDRASHGLLPHFARGQGWRDVFGVEAAAAARATDKTWKEAHVAAQQAGYKGNLDALMRMMAKKVAAARKPGRPAKAAPAAPVPKKRGRPARVTVAAPAVPTLDPVAAQYLVSAIDKAIAELQKLRQQYAR